MGRIFIRRAQQGPPTRAGTVKPGWPEYMTRERRAMAGFGEAVFSLGRMLGQKHIDQLVQAEFAEGKATLQRKDNEFFASLIDDPNYEKYPERYKNESKKWRKEILSKYKTPGARNALKNMITADAPRMEKNITGIIRAKAQEDARRKVLTAIQGTDEEKGFIPSAGATSDELELGIINATAAMQGAVESGLYSRDEGEEIIIYALMTDWPEVALKEIDASSLDPRRKIQLKSNAKTVIRNIENKKRIIEQEVWDKTEGEAFNLWFDNELTPEWIREQFNLGNMSAQDRDAYLSAITRPKEVPLNWGVYDKLLEMVKEYEKENVTKDEVRLAITNALGKDIPETAAIRLREKLNTIDKPDDPMNRSNVKRGLGVLDDLESFEIEQAKKDDADFEVVREIRLAYQKKKDEFEQWIKGQEKLTDTDIQNKIDQMTQLEAEEVVLHWLGRLMRPKETTPFFRHFGTTEEKALARKRAKAGVEEQSKKLTAEIARQFLEQANGDRKRAEELAKEAGYEW